jgi:hypothetical protein
MIFEKFWIFFKKKKHWGAGPGKTRPAQPFGLGQNWHGPMAKLIILSLHAEMNSACSGLDEEEGGDAGRRTT